MHSQHRPPPHQGTQASPAAHRQPMPKAPSGSASFVAEPGGTPSRTTAPEIGIVSLCLRGSCGSPSLVPLGLAGVRSPKATSRSTRNKASASAPPREPSFPGGTTTTDAEAPSGSVSFAVQSLKVRPPRPRRPKLGSRVPEQSRRARPSNPRPPLAHPRLPAAAPHSNISSRSQQSEVHATQAQHLVTLPKRTFGRKPPHRTMAPLPPPSLFHEPLQKH